MRGDGDLRNTGRERQLPWSWRRDLFTSEWLDFRKGNEHGQLFGN